MSWKTYHYSCNQSIDVVNSEKIFRPYVELIVRHDGVEAPVSVLLDSGCETTTLHTDIAKFLGIDLSSCETCSVTGVGVKSRTGYRSRVMLYVHEFDYEFETPVIFADIQILGLLGQNNFFEHFRVLFEGNKKQFKLHRI